MADDEAKQNKVFEEGKNLSELLNEAMDLRGLDAKKVAELTDIPAHYVAALSEGEFEKLPAIPYVRGYLTRIAEALRIDVNLVLSAYQREIISRSLKTSGAEDKLPQNRFGFKRSYWKKIFLGVIIVGLLFLVYRFWGIDNILGTPKIEIISPSLDNLIVNVSSIKLSGQVSPGDKLTINDEEVLTGKDGRFEKNFSLQPGTNPIEFKAKRFLGKETTIIRHVIYQP